MGNNAPIIVAVDGSESSNAAVRWAAQDAALRAAPLRLVFVFDIAQYFVPGYGYVASTADYEEGWHEVLAAATELAKQTAASIRPIEIESSVIEGRVATALIAESKDARLLVVGNRGHGTVSRAVLGSVSSAVTRHAHCPVAVIQAGTPPRDLDKLPIVVGVDGTANSEPAIKTAFEEASRRRVPLVAVHAWSDVSESLTYSLDWSAAETAEYAALAESLAGWQEQFPDVPVRQAVVKDRPAHNLLELSADAQLIVVGSHGRGGFAGMVLGSTSQALLQSVACPIIVVRGPA
ncbi:MAG: universal stress protein [Nocardiaceae bacterium]|nr:universal stress protein [Nocardiaceae bacterium]